MKKTMSEEDKKEDIRRKLDYIISCLKVFLRGFEKDELYLIREEINASESMIDRMIKSIIDHLMENRDGFRYAVNKVISFLNCTALTIFSGHVPVVDPAWLRLYYHCFKFNPDVHLSLCKYYPSSFPSFGNNWRMTKTKNYYFFVDSLHTELSIEDPEQLDELMDLLIRELCSMASICDRMSFFSPASDSTASDSSTSDSTSPVSIIRKPQSGRIPNLDMTDPLAIEGETNTLFEFISSL